MKIILSGVLLFATFISAHFPQNQYKIMSYNLLNYPGNNSTVRNPYFKTIVESVEPDILVVQEMLSQAGVNGFLNNVLNLTSSEYVAGTFIDGPDTDNAIFYKNTSITFLVNNIIPTGLRNISEFVLLENTSGDTLRIYSVHLKAGTTAADQQQRLAEVTALRNVTDLLHDNSHFIVCGDFNIYNSNEAGYQKLKNQSTSGYFIDIINLTGTWNNESYASFHTQSTRVRQFGGGATGGLDDRFDMILFSQALMDTDDVFFEPGSFVNYGNDGDHYNDSINKPPNSVVSQQIADALHYSSDHIPVFAIFNFEQKITQQISVNLIDGWNMISVPLSATDMTASSLFPTAVSPFYLYSSNGYSQVDVLGNGKGYWAKFDGEQSQSISGSSLSNNEIFIEPGWNLIGPFDFNAPVSEITIIPPNIIISPFFEYNNGYNPSVILMPGKGYWVKANQSGTIQLNIE